MYMDLFVKFLPTLSTPVKTTKNDCATALLHPAQAHVLSNTEKLTILAVAAQALLPKHGCARNASRLRRDLETCQVVGYVWRVVGRSNRPKNPPLHKFSRVETTANIPKPHSLWRADRQHFTQANCGYFPVTPKLSRVGWTVRVCMECVQPIPSIIYKAHHS